MMKQIGIIVSVKGYDGSVIISVNSSSFPLIPEGTNVNLGYSQRFSRIYKINSWIKKNNKIIAKFDGISDDKEARNLLEFGVFLDEEQIKIYKPDYVDNNDIIGCKVIEFESQNIIGRVAEIWQMPANDVYVIHADKGILPIPVIDEVIKIIDLDKKEINITMIPGLMELMNVKSKKKRKNEN